MVYVCLMLLLLLLLSAADFILFLVMALKTFRIFKAAQTSLALPSDEDTDGEGVRIWNTRYVCAVCGGVFIHVHTCILI